ncbi:uncharacterized protein LOC128663111 [Bombina bombina]|uniref:uncharacterized protein LOC128663111 n=1 Tax=Bombina bombina TaxID=8345 RepID=UPI00235A81D3|nr:uncharacterized protein LOC128663111 [Bombina bombina]
MEISTPIWTSKEYTLQEYLSKYADSFPNIIKVTEGYLGKQEIDSLSSSMVIRVNSVYNQKRAVAESKVGKVFSIPFNVKNVKFLLAQNNASVSGIQPMTLEDILSKYNLPVSVTASKVIAFKEKGDQLSQDEMLPELTIQDTYEQVFLLGHPIDKGKLLIREPIMIPMYMTELKLVVAVGFADGNTDRWNDVCAWFTKQVTNEGNIAEIALEEIFLLDKKDLSPQEPRYSTIEPIYIDLSELYQNHKVQLENTETVTVNPDQAYDVKAKENCTEPSLPQSQENKHFTNISDIPSDLHGLNVKQVCECLEILNMKQYVKAFSEALVDGHILYELDREMMLSCLGMNGLNIAKLLKFREGWRPNI